MRKMYLGLGGLGALCAALPIMAQETSVPSAPDYVENLRACRVITDNAARLACFDRAAGNVIAASDSGDLRIVAREDLRETRRRLFGFALPSGGLFGGDRDDPADAIDTLESTISAVRFSRGNTLTFSIAEGSVWEISEGNSRMRLVKPGDAVEFERAPLGSYWVRIDGQRAAKGRRIE